MGVPDRDPFDFPPSIIPPGMTYQWCAKTIFGEPNPQYRTMIEAGWMPVPKERHPFVFRSFDAGGNVCVGGQVLMGRLREFTEDAHAINHDKAYRNAQATHRIVTHPIGEFILSKAEMQDATTAGISCAEYARRRANAIAEGRDPDAVIVGDLDPEYGPSGKFKFARKRQPRRFAAWLFDLISKEGSSK